MQRFGRYAGRPVKFNFLPASAGVPALQSGSVDILGGGIFITEERQKTLDFASSHFNAHPGYYVKDEASHMASVSFGQRMKDVFRNNLIVENRWKYITGGLWETVKISVLAILLGSLLGAGVCWIKSKMTFPFITGCVFHANFEFCKNRSLSKNEERRFP